MTILIEEKRSELISQQKSSRNYNKENRDKGKNRYQRRLTSKISSSIKHFNKIDMNDFFKQDKLTTNIDVSGETNVYVVSLSFEGILEELNRLLSDDKPLDRKLILTALTRAFNKDDISIGCTCPDFTYRHRHHATQKNMVVGREETRPNQYDRTNKNKDMGAACKHITLALTDSSWLIKVASVIFNYIEYMEKRQERLYQRFIYPAIYKKEYTDETQLDITDIDGDEAELETDSDTLDAANIEARRKGQFQRDNEYRFRKDQPEDGEQQQFDIDSIDDE